MSAVARTNYRSVAPGFVNRATYYLRPTANPSIVDAGSAPWVLLTGVALSPLAGYKHVAIGMTRPITGALDIGAYEATSYAP